MKEFEESELTKTVVSALKYYIGHFRMYSSKEWDNRKEVNQEIEDLLERIQKEKLDVRLYSREY